MAVGFIVIPNMIAVLLLSPKFFEIFHGYLADLKRKERSYAVSYLPPINFMDVLAAADSPRLSVVTSAMCDTIKNQKKPGTL